MDIYTYILVMASPVIVLGLIIIGAEKIKTYTFSFLYNRLNLSWEQTEKWMYYLWLAWFIPLMLLCLFAILQLFIYPT